MSETTDIVTTLRDGCIYHARTSGCFICRPEDPAFADVEGCPSCEADFGRYLESLVHAFALTGDTDAVARLLGVDETDAARVVAHCQEMEGR